MFSAQAITLQILKQIILHQFFNIFHTGNCTDFIADIDQQSE